MVIWIENISCNIGPQRHMFVFIFVPTYCDVAYIFVFYSKLWLVSRNDSATPFEQETLDQNGKTKIVYLFMSTYIAYRHQACLRLIMNENKLKKVAFSPLSILG